jgi:hypothetical protein
MIQVNSIDESNKSKAINSSAEVQETIDLENLGIRRDAANTNTKNTLIKTKSLSVRSSSPTNPNFDKWTNNLTSTVGASKPIKSAQIENFSSNNNQSTKKPPPPETDQNNNQATGKKQLIRFLVEKFFDFSNNPSYKRGA